MVNHSDATLDATLAALAHPTRRRVVAALAEGPRPLMELSRPHAMSLPGFMKHLRVLEGARLITRRKHGRVVTCSLDAAPMKAAVEWLTRYREFWEPRLDRLVQLLDTPEENDSCHPPQPSSSLPSKALRSRWSGTSTPPRKRSGKRSSSRER